MLVDMMLILQLLIGAAIILKSMKIFFQERFLIFQPSEENCKGAKAYS